LYAKCFLVVVIQQRGILKKTRAGAFSKISVAQVYARVFILENSRVPVFLKNRECRLLSEMPSCDQSNTFEADDLPPALMFEDVPRVHAFWGRWFASLWYRCGKEGVPRRFTVGCHSRRRNLGTYLK